MIYAFELAYRGNASAINYFGGGAAEIQFRCNKFRLSQLYSLIFTCVMIVEYTNSFRIIHFKRTKRCDGRLFK